GYSESARSAALVRDVVRARRAGCAGYGADGSRRASPGGWVDLAIAVIADLVDDNAAFVSRRSVGYRNRVENVVGLLAGIAGQVGCRVSPDVAALCYGNGWHDRLDRD